MSQQNKEKVLPDYPRAPPLNSFDDNVLMQRPAPPSYEQSQQAQIQQQTYAYAHPTMYANQAYGAPGPSNGFPGAQYVAAPGYHQAYAMPPQQTPILTLAQGAEIRMNNGAVTIPPPPPGYAPTPAQWAAMQGQQVLVKEQKKRAFFS